MKMVMNWKIQPGCCSCLVTVLVIGPMWLRCSSHAPVMDSLRLALRSRWRGAGIHGGRGGVCEAERATSEVNSLIHISWKGAGGLCGMFRTGRPVSEGSIVRLLTV